MKLSTEHRRRMDEPCENLNKEIENIREYQTEVTELKNKITQLKDTWEGLNSRLDETEQISNLEDKAVKLTQTEQ